MEVKSILVDLPSTGQWTSYKGALTQCREMKVGDRKKKKEKEKKKKKKDDDLIGIKRGEEATIKSTKGWISGKEVKITTEVDVRRLVVST